MMPRDLDIVVFGATGYTGKLVCEYLSRLSLGSAGRWAIAGRNEEKLKQLQKELGTDASVLVADINDPESMDKMCSKTNVLISCAGPFTQAGLPVVEACVRCLTHYVDCTGEYNYIRQVIERFHDEAKRKRIVLVPCCAFDSVPSDLCNYIIHQGLADQIAEVKAFYQLSIYGVSGGTARSFLALSEGCAPEDADPFSLLPKDAPRPKASVFSERRGVWYDTAERKLTGPSLVGTTNERVVRRTNALLGYGSTYTEALEGSVWNVVSATLVFYLTAAALKVPFFRRFAAKYLISHAGEGPTQAQKELCWYKGTFIAVDKTGKRLRRVCLSDAKDMYTASALYIVEAALSALKMMKDGSLHYGVLTPMSAFGDVYRQRVQNAGVVIEVVDEAVKDSSSNEN